MAEKGAADDAIPGRIWRGLIVVLITGLVVVPFLLNGDAMFLGTDDSARLVITQIAPGTTPWARPLWSPPSEQVESLLFGLQAFLGGAMLVYIFEFRRRRPRSCGVPDRVVGAKGQMVPSRTPEMGENGSASD